MPKEVEILELPKIRVGDAKKVSMAIQESTYILEYLDVPESSFLPFDVASRAVPLWLACKDQGDSSVAVALLRTCLRHPEPLVRTAAAVGLSPLFDESGVTRSSFPEAEPKEVVAILNAATQSDDEAVRELGAVAIGPPPHMRFAGAAPQPCPSTDTSFIIPGTFSYCTNWWRRGGAFHSYLLNGPKPNLYAGIPWDWAGSFRERARQTAAKRFAEWTIEEKKITSYDTLMGHSYGGGVALMSTRQGVATDILVLMSTPARDYAPDWAKVQRCVSLRIAWDLILLGDAIVHGPWGQKARQRFKDPHVEELPTLGAWFDHRITHDPGVWASLRVPDMIWHDSPFVLRVSAFPLGGAGSGDRVAGPSPRSPAWKPPETVTSPASQQVPSVGAPSCASPTADDGGCGIWNCCGNPLEARAVLEGVAQSMPRRRAAEFRRIVGPLDDLY